MISIAQFLWTLRREYVHISIKKEAKLVSSEKVMTKYCSIKQCLVPLLQKEIFQSILIMGHYWFFLQNDFVIFFNF